ncbi:MAG: NapC/NirT family cytochrome c [Halochromatium sp.]
MHPTTNQRHGLALAAAMALGILGGVGLFTLGYGNGLAYLTDDPTACTNCHIMQDHFDAWVKSSHQGVAGCNDCHLPADVIGKWLTKADNGFFHALAFTTGQFHERAQSARDPVRLPALPRRLRRSHAPGRAWWRDATLCPLPSRRRSCAAALNPHQRSRGL